ncbi:unnamed protein product [Lactuca virosa]|uniref:RRM domain-containing protein n=1 Tax=Lactuca virosa TaxID=75947 RepID=A0AAU9NPR5_9ASTR|nr:unnamed protein product [Lactuca virosa]
MAGEWREVRRKGSSVRKFQGKLEGNITTYFVTNLRGDVKKAELWKPCSKVGALVDIYIADRRDASGTFFAFVGFKNVLHPKGIEKELNEITCRGRKVAANCAKHPKAVTVDVSKRPADAAMNRFSSAHRDARSFVEVGKGIGTPYAGEAHASMSLNLSVHDWADASVLVGDARCFDTLCNFPALISWEGYDVMETKYLGGMQVLVKFRSETAADVFKANKCIWKKWFNWVERLGRRSVRFEMITCIKITGVLMAWVAGNFGRVLVNNCSFWGNNDASFCKLCILTASRKKINEEIMVNFDGAGYKIGIFEVEDDWVPFKPFVAESPVDSDVEEDDDDVGISDTWVNCEMEMEEGEIRHNDDGDGDGAVTELGKLRRRRCIRILFRRLES